MAPRGFEEITNSYKRIQQQAGAFAGANNAKAKEEAEKRDKKELDRQASENISYIAKILRLKLGLLIPSQMGSG